MHEAIIVRAAEIVAGKCNNAGYCTLAQIDADGYPTAATISVSRADGIKWVAFCTGLGSNWVSRAEKCGRASLCFNSDSPLYNITLVGSIEVLTDLASKKEMWYDGMGYYFSGPDDPAFCVLKFTTRRYSLMFNEEEGSARGTLAE
ncbi:MAG: pyridoxamine 5'-phosphate oxidase family protein [Defluviitaleaceae bacterium]|nr:pyridoxamine 5'-phosphate oxidase family protein [Defluviitaleaceae bacterium]